MPAPSLPSPAATAQRMRAQRGAGLAMLGSALALVALAALTWAGVLPFDDGARSWAALGLGAAGLVDGAIGLFFLNASSQP